MLRRDLDFVPQSPNPAKKVGITRLGMGPRASSGGGGGVVQQRVSGKSFARRREEVFSETEIEELESVPATSPPREAELRTPVPVSKMRGMSSSEGNFHGNPFSNLSPATPLGRHRRAQSCADVEQARPAAVFRAEHGHGHGHGWKGERSVSVRTMEEKKEILSGMLGNVDALVEGVRKAGVWGLG